MGRRRKEVAVSELDSLTPEELDNLNELSPEEIDSLKEEDVATLEDVGIDSADVVLPLVASNPPVVERVTLSGVVRQILNIKTDTRVGIIDMAVRGVAPLNVVIPKDVRIGDVVNIDVYK